MSPQINININEANEKDINGIFNIYNDVILHSTAIYEEEIMPFNKQVKWFTDKKKSGYPIYVAKTEELVVGFGYFNKFREYSGFSKTIEHSIYIKSEYIGQGIGKSLLKTLINKAYNDKYHSMIAGIDSKNIASLKLHKNFGFDEIACFKEIGNKFGNWLDLIFLQLILKKREEAHWG